MFNCVQYVPVLNPRVIIVLLDYIISNVAQIEVNRHYLTILYYYDNVLNTFLFSDFEKGLIRSKYNCECVNMTFYVGMSRNTCGHFSSS